MLNFYSRVSCPSIKNFQLGKDGDPNENIFLQFGKIDKQHFNLDFQYPLSPLQAFLIALSSFDFKVKVEI